MKHQAQKDERVVSEKRKIQSNGFQIVWIVLLISILIQQYLYSAPFAQYAVELLVFIAMSLYVLIANIAIGNDVFAPKKRGQATVVINSLVTGTTVAVINTIINYINYSDRIPQPAIAHIALVAGITFISATIAAFAVLEVFYIVNYKKQQAIDKKLNDDDMDE